tara:strand:- start:10263 stop:10604 length:342 start_codon:yes stop_codon:yes gene_type:complete
MSECIQKSTNKYAFRNSPPFPANQCKSMKKKGNDGLYYLSEPNKNGTHRWVQINKKKTLKQRATKIDLQMLAKKYGVTKSGTNKEIAERLLHLREYLIKNKTDKQIINQFVST